MCGIAGLVSLTGASPREVAEIVGRMVDAIAHRGPDGRGASAWEPDAGTGPVVGLGHARLAIIDLSPGGAQPMSSPRRPVTVTYNGEIYNFAEVRRELESLGRAFRTASDTEVVLQGYEEWGRNVVSRLRGMFAFAVWDGDRRELTLARDRFGIKPLYVHRSADHLVFGSEIRALLASGRVPARLDRTALDLYLRYQTVPAPRTLVHDVTLLPPGSTATFDARGELRVDTYWNLLDQRAAGVDAGDEAATRERVRALLRESAALHMVSDVPVGIFLSGGIDSSALVSLVHANGHRPRTFAVTLAGTPLDESRHARAVADAFGAQHTEIPLDEATMLAALPDALAAVDHPSGDGINTFIVSRAVRQTGMKVALSGLGGDEIFGGYPSFQRLSRLPAFAGFWRHTPPSVRRAAAATVRSVGGGSVAAAKTAAILEGDASLPAVFPVLREVFSRDDRHALLGRVADDAADPYRTLLTDAASRSGTIDTAALISYAEARTYMHDVLLRDTDQMSMHHALEVRVPFLDHRLAEFVVGLPASVKLVSGRQKPLLVDALDPPLPPAGVERPKQGFVLPFDAWMRGPLRAFCEARLGTDGLGGRGVMDPAALDDLWRRFLSHAPSTTWARPWTLVALDAWLARTGVSG